MSKDSKDDDLAYGNYYDHHADQHQSTSDRGIISDVFNHLRGPPPSVQPDVTQTYQPHLFNQAQQASSSSNPGQQSSFGGMSSLFDRVQGAVQHIGHEVKSKLGGIGLIHSHTHLEGKCHQGAHQQHVDNRFVSFAPQREGNEAKWYVDGCGYMWAVSVALENARDSIWILDWWLTPELYLRRPPAKNEKYRLDNMLLAAANRGVLVYIIVYKEVTQALTLSSSHTKHALEDLHQNIKVFRHPDHIPDKSTIASSFVSSFQNITLNAATASNLSSDALQAIYGVNNDTILYWAHHEKLCLVDGRLAFMGGLDLCFGRWDTNQHSIADAHPGDLDRIVFTGQDYNNSRIMDFDDVTHWQNNKLDRSQNSRMGWSDISLSLTGPVVEDLKEHFVQRWNFVFDEKYGIRKDPRYSRLTFTPTAGSSSQSTLLSSQPQQEVEGGGYREKIKERFEEGVHRLEERHGGGQFRDVSHLTHHNDVQVPSTGFSCQIARSCCRWSNGNPVEHSIANAYIEVIKNSQHFVYIENQFFITATTDEQKPIENKIGAAIVERILRAARAGQKYMVFVMMPAVPAFAGDLRNDDALGTRAIMEFQYRSINRGGGHSIMETIAREGFNPMDYIRFYNLRNYDRINVSAAMATAEQQSGVSYDEARKQFDEMHGGAAPADATQASEGNPYGAYQHGAQEVGSRRGLGSGRWDSVAECYMLNGEDIRNVPWEQGDVSEIDAFVTEELYIHSKLLIADDRVVICGSANLNDRSQLGSHDSEIAVIIEDRASVDSTMNGSPWRASKFAASLRRQIFRKHLGLLKPQNYEVPDANYEPVSSSPNNYDWGSDEDQVVADPLSQDFLNRWNYTAKSNTDIFAKVFHPVPYDGVRTWKDYDEWYEKFFHQADPKEKEKRPPGAYIVGHVVREEFPGGVQEVKEMLSRVRGSLVEMPLLFLKDENIAPEGLGLNAFTEEVYT